MFFRLKQNSDASNIVFSAQTLFYGLEQKKNASNIVLREKTMFEGLGRKREGLSGRDTGGDAANPLWCSILPVDRRESAKFYAAADRAPAAIAALISRASWAISRSMPVGEMWKPQK